MVVVVALMLALVLAPVLVLAPPEMRPVQPAIHAPTCYEYSSSLVSMSIAHCTSSCELLGPAPPFLRPQHTVRTQ